MGSALCMPKCETAVTHSVVTFSEELVKKLVEGIEPPVLSNEELNRREMDDYEWFEKLKCIDRSHSNAYGLTLEGFEGLVNRIEKRLAKLNKETCSTEQVKSCYKENCYHSLKCQKEANDFIDCVDGKYVSLILKQSRNTDD